VVIIIVLVALDSSKSRTPTAAPPTTTATTTTTTTPPAKGLSITLAQVESFYNARGAETQWWIHGANINGPGCSPTCGERNEDGGAGTGCQLQILGPAGDVDSVLIGCEPGEALSATNKTILTSQAALAILVATVNQFAPFASSWARQELTMGLGDAKEVDAMHSNATTSVDVSASQKVASLEIQVRTT
jgi:hypothetical protein